MADSCYLSAMRLFVAVPLPSSALEEAGGLLRGLRGQEWPVRWVRDDGLHITLKFFGEVTSDRLEPIEELLQFATQGMAPLALPLAGRRAFWAGGGAPARTAPGGPPAGGPGGTPPPPGGGPGGGDRAAPGAGTTTGPRPRTAAAGRGGGGGGGGAERDSVRLSEAEVA